MKNPFAAKRALITTSVIALSFGISDAAIAQADTLPSANANTQSNSGMIIVTARKREESLLEVPVSVSALGQEQLEAADITNPVELSDYVPGLDFQAAASGTDGGGSNPNITFRGIRPQLNGPSNQVGAIFWDGAYMGSGAGIVPIDDLERVEVIKGPQTAFFGRNTFAGAINYIPASADDDLSGKVEMLYSPSDFDSYKISGAVGIPIGDRSGLRISAVHKRDGGDYAFGDGSPLNERNKTAVSAVFTTEPVDGLNLKFSGYYVDADDTYVNVSIAATTPAGQCDRIVNGLYVNSASGQTTPFTRDFSQLPFATFCGQFPRGTDANIITPQALVPTAANTVGGDTSASFQGNELLSGFGFIPGMPGGFGGNHRTYRFQLNGDYELSGGHTISVIAARAAFGSSYSFDQNFGLNATGLLLPRGFQTYIKETYLEARFASAQDQRFRYMIGTTYYEQQFRNGGTGPVPNVTFEDSESISVFAALDFDITDELTISGEGRYTDDSVFVPINGNPNLPIGNPSVTRDASNSFSKFIPRAILSFRPTDRTNIYISYSRSALIGEQTNAAVVSGLDPLLIPDPSIFGEFTPPQKNTSYEIGWKQQFDGISFSLTGFYMEWQNQVFRNTVLAGTQTSTFARAGESKYLGLEFEAFANPTDWLDLSGGILLVDAELVDFESRTTFESSVLGSGILSVVANGNRPKGVSEFQASASATIHGEVMGTEAYIRGDLIYNGGFFADNQEFNYVESAARVNLRGGIELDNGLAFEVYAKNLTDSRQLNAISFTTFGLGSDRKIFDAPPIKREIGVRLKFAF